MKFKDFFNYFLLKDSIENIEFKGEWDSDEGHGWDKSDIGILKSPVGLNKIKTSWKIKQPVDIYFVKNESTEGWSEHGRLSKKRQEHVLSNIRARDKQWGDTFLNDKIEPNPDHISIVYISNKGDEKIPSTSWILAHRFGHTLGVVDGQYDANPLYTKIRKTVDDLFNNVSNFVYQRDMSVDYSRYSGQRSRELKPGESEEEHNAKLIQNKERLINQHQLAMALGTFKSARDRKLSRTTEFINEIVAQYIIAGKITLNRDFMKVLDPEKSLGEQKQVSPEEQENINSYFSSMEKYLNSYMENLLNDAVGKVFIM